MVNLKGSCLGYYDLDLNWHLLMELAQKLSHEISLSLEVEPNLKPWKKQFNTSLGSLGKQVDLFLKIWKLDQTV